ncbi:EthD domain-containing protein [Paraburkholderia strydomiana]|uniref:EthD domain-containing protein n=1 Tax=Paraburkholderia strydomiana TaxID=1245417 RepID=UPI0028608228|nr:EthD domain-containing protein [Paraburkholderia strydomiana]MDR7009296.1 hypothetical protein [Paraburkholderia strydomiana]
MHTIMTVLRKRPEISTEAFRHFMEFQYGPTYVAMPQTRAYVHYYLSDAAADAAESPIDAIVTISFESRDAMDCALQSDGYRSAQIMRKAFLLDASIGVHPAVVDRVVKLV